jgi:pimeloyl-ACP methyl ester carboxylesterase
MSHHPINGCSYFYTDTGDGDETLVFGHGFLMTHRMWDPLVDALSDRYRCVAFDWRGQGRSEVTESGYDVPDLARDVVALIDDLDLGRVHYVGLSMGGFVGFDLLAHHSDRLASALLLDSSAEAEPLRNRLQYYAMLEAVKRIGYEPVIDRVVPMLFGPTFREEQPEALRTWIDRITAQDRTGIYRAGRGIFRREGVLSALGQARTPTLLLVGADDNATPPERSEKAHDALPNSQLVILPRSGHSSAIERPDAVTHHIETFLDERAT